MIAHRLSTIEHADRIVVLDRAPHRRAGTHDELMARTACTAASASRRSPLARLQLLDIDGTAATPNGSIR